MSACQSNSNYELCFFLLFAGHTLLYLYQQYDLRKRGVGNEGENELRAREK
jgi:hypothetical protein